MWIVEPWPSLAVQLYLCHGRNGPPSMSRNRTRDPQKRRIIPRVLAKRYSWLWTVVLDSRLVAFFCSMAISSKPLSDGDFGKLMHFQRGGPLAG